MSSPNSRSWGKDSYSKGISRQRDVSSVRVVTRPDVPVPRLWDEVVDPLSRLGQVEVGELRVRLPPGRGGFKEGPER